MSVELDGDEAGLVGYWKLNNSLLDETSNDNDLTNNNSATFSTDVPFSGSSIKSINGLLKASIKSRNGLAIADIKSINGLS